MVSTPLSYYAISGLVNFIAALPIGIVVILRNSKATTNRIFSILSFSVAFWSFFYFLWLTTPDKAIAEFYMRTCMIGVFYMPSLFIHFVTSFLKIKIDKKFLLLNYLLSIIFTFTAYSSLYATGVSRHLVFPYWLIPGPVFHIAIAHFFLIILYSFYLMHRAIENSKGIFRSQVLYIFIGTAIGYISGSTNYFSWYRIPFPPFLNIFVSLYVIFIAYAIVKHRLWDIRLVFIKSLVYSLLILSIASLYVLVIFYLIDPIKETFNISPNMTFVLTGFLIVFGFNPFKKLIEKLTDKFFYKGRYHPGKLLERLGKIMNSTLLLEPLVDSLLKTILKEMRVKKGAFVLTSSPKLKEVKEIGYQKVPFSSWKKLTPFLQTKALLVRDELEEESKEKSLLRELDVSVIVPFLMEKEPVGLLVLGEKKSGDMYTLQDLNFLEALSPQVSIALHNALLFKKEQKKVLELNSLNKLSSSLVKTLDLQTLLNQVIVQALKVTGAQSGSIMLLNEETQTLSIKASQGIPQEIVKETRLKLREGIAGFVAQQEKPLILSKNKKTPFKEELKRAEITSSLTVPLKTKEKVVGVLNINRKEKEPFLEEDLNLISSFAAQAAVAIENARLYTEAITDGLTGLYNHHYWNDPRFLGHLNQVVKRYLVFMRDPKFSRC